MKRYLLFYTIIPLFIGVCSCTSSETDVFTKYKAFLKEEFESLEILHEKAHKPVTIKFSEATEKRGLPLEIELIRLETTPESLIGYVGNIMHDEGKIFIGDNINHSIFIFSENGKFISRIHKVGRGPGEYNKMTDFSLDKINKRVILYDAQKKGYHHFGYDGTYMESKRFGFWFREFCIAPSGNYLLYTNNGNETGFGLFQTDSTGISFKKKGIPRTGFYKMNAYSTPHLDIYKEEVLVSFPFSYDIYAVKEDSLYCKYKLNLEGQDFPYDWEEPLGYDDYEALFKSSNKEYRYGGNFIENDQFALFLLNTKELGKPLALAYNKKTNAIVKTRLTYPETSLFIFPKSTFYNKFAGVLDAHLLIEHGLHQKYPAIANIHENDNPCLVLFSIKTDE